MRKKGENKTEKEEMKKGRKILSICLGLFSFMNVYVRVRVRVVCLSVCLWACIHWYRCSQSSVEGVRSPGATVIGKCKKQAIAFESLGPLQEWGEFLTA